MPSLYTNRVDSYAVVSILRNSMPELVKKEKHWEKGYGGN